MERKALYNSLRMDQREEILKKTPSWKVENYRLLSENSLFERLLSLGIHLDKLRFSALAEEVDSPEELYELILDEEPEDVDLGDQIYLILFELFRRFVPEKQSLSIFCDELDELILRYDRDDYKAEEPLEIALDFLKNILNDCEGDPIALFDHIKENTAHDIEPFLYDYISTQIENKDDSFAEHLIDGFLPFVSDKKWFEFLKAKVTLEKDEKLAFALIQKLIKENQKNPDLDLNLEMLDFFAKEGEGFKTLLFQTLPLITLEEEFVDILASTEEYFNLRDLDEEEAIVSNMRNKREHKSLEAPFSQQDPDVAILRGLNFR